MKVAVESYLCPGLLCQGEHVLIEDGFQDDDLEENAHKPDEIFDFGDFLLTLEHLSHILFHQLCLLVPCDVVEYGHLATGRYHDLQAVGHVLVVPCDVPGVCIVSLGHGSALLLLLQLALDGDLDLLHGQPFTRLSPVLLLVIH